MRIQRGISGRTKGLNYLVAQSGVFPGDCEQYYVRLTYSISFSYQLSSYFIGPHLTWRSSARSVSRRDSHSVHFLRVLIILQKPEQYCKGVRCDFIWLEEQEKSWVLFTVCSKEILELLSGFVLGVEEEIHLCYFDPKITLKSHRFYI